MLLRRAGLTASAGLSCCIYVSNLADTAFYGWPALLTFGFSGNPALLLLVLNCRDCCLFESNKYLLLRRRRCAIQM